MIILLYRTGAIKNKIVLIATRHIKITQIILNIVFFFNFAICKYDYYFMINLY